MKGQEACWGPGLLWLIRGSRFEMKATPLTQTVLAEKACITGAVPAEARTPSENVRTRHDWFAIYSELFKARLTLLVLLTTLVGFYLGVRGRANYFVMLNTILGTAL